MKITSLVDLGPMPECQLRQLEELRRKAAEESAGTSPEEKERDAEATVAMARKALYAYLDLPDPIQTPGR